MDMLCSNLVKFDRREIGEIARCLPNKKQQNFAWLSSCRYWADRAQNLPGPTPGNILKNALDFIQIGLLSAEL